MSTAHSAQSKRAMPSKEPENVYFVDNIVQDNTSNLWMSADPLFEGLFSLDFTWGKAWYFPVQFYDSKLPDVLETAESVL